MDPKVAHLFPDSLESLNGITHYAAAPSYPAFAAADIAVCSNGEVVTECLAHMLPTMTC